LNTEKAMEKPMPETGLARGFRNRRDPFKMMRYFTEDMENMLDAFGFGRRMPRLTLFERDPFDFKHFEMMADFSPEVEMEERDGKLIVRADLPGMEMDDIDVEITDRELIIRGERKSESEEEKEGFFRSERSYGKFYRRLPIPESVETQDAKAYFANGVLEITMTAPKGVSSARKLEITGGEKMSHAAVSGG